MEGGGLATMAMVQPEPLEWMIEGLIPRNELTLLAGPSECGKSTFLALMVAHATTGGKWSRGDDHPPGRALVYPLEEAAGAAPLERLTAAGADLSRIAVGTKLPNGKSAPLPYLPDLFAALAQRVRACRATMVYFDPITSLLGPGFNVNDGQHVRSVLVPLQDLARELGLVILFTMNYRKALTGDASSWVSGHKDWWNVPRHILCFGRDPRQPERGVLAVGKQGRGKKASSITYTVEQRDGADFFVTIGKTAFSARDLGCEMEDEIGRNARELARNYLKRVLADVPEKVSKLMLECQAGGFSPHTLERAAADLGVSKEFVVNGSDRAWYWSKPKKWPD